MRSSLDDDISVMTEDGEVGGLPKSPKRRSGSRSPVSPFQATSPSSRSPKSPASPNGLSPHSSDSDGGLPILGPNGFSPSAKCMPRYLAEPGLLLACSVAYLLRLQPASTVKASMGLHPQLVIIQVLLSNVSSERPHIHHFCVQLQRN